jgi:hypothetical protein
MKIFFLVDGAEQSGKKKIVMESRTESSKDGKNVLLLKKNHFLSYINASRILCAVHLHHNN